MINYRVKCAQCGLSFLRPKRQVAEANKKNWNQYCSTGCQFSRRETGKILQCARPGCEVSFYRSLSEIKKVKRSYCSGSCAAFVNNQTKPRRILVRNPCAREKCGRTVPKYKKFCTRECYTFDRIRNDGDNLLKLLTATARRLGRSPAKRELGSVAHECIRRFGSWNMALQVAGLKPNRSHEERMYRRSRTWARDGHKCDSVSEAIIDNWLHEHNIEHERDAKYPDTKHRADWKLKNGIFIEYFGLAKDSPRYDQTMKEKRHLCLTHGISLIELFPPDLYPVSKLRERLFSVCPRP